MADHSLTGIGPSHGGPSGVGSQASHGHTVADGRVPGKCTTTGSRCGYRQCTFKGALARFKLKFLGLRVLPPTTGVEL
eukprot:2966672-Rhodomonas_salina.2